MKNKWLAALAMAALGVGAGNAAADDNLNHHFYAGAFAGASDGQTNWTYKDGGDTADHDTDGGVYGVDFGWAANRGHLYGAIEGDYAGADISGSASCPNPSYTCSSQLDWLASVRLALGYQAGSWAVYGTAGPAWARATIETNDGAGPYGEDKTVGGVAVGAGAQYAFTPNWSVRGEYLYYDFGKSDFTVDNDLGVSADIKTSVLTIGVNYAF